jgi:hypothetical protein
MWRLVLSLSIPSALVACSGDDTTTPTTEPTTDDTGLELVEDVFLQELITPVDILWVVDPGWDDGMEAFAEAIENGYETLLVTDASWRFGVLDASTDPTSQGFGLIGAKFETYPPPANAFELGTADGPPHVRDVVYAALQQRLEHQANVEFLRPEAHLYVLAFTDEEDASADVAVKSSAAWHAWFEALQPSESKRLGAITEQEVANYWNTHAVGASVFQAGSFRAGIPAQLRDAIGQRIEFTLSQVPSGPLAKVSVVYREREEIFVEPAFTFSNTRNSISFTDYVPPPDSEIRVSYPAVPAAETATTGGTTPPAE